jgi:hypothetical protein
MQGGNAILRDKNITQSPYDLHASSDMKKIPPQSRKKRRGEEKKGKGHHGFIVCGLTIEGLETFSEMFSIFAGKK